MSWTMPDIDGDTIEITACTDGSVEMAIYNDERVSLAALRRPEVERLVWLLYVALEEAAL